MAFIFMNNFLDMGFFGEQQLSLILISGSFIFLCLLAGVFVYAGLDVWNMVVESRRDAKLRSKLINFRKNKKKK
jgi:hypothetical protein